MTNELATAEPAALELSALLEREPAVRALLLGGVGAAPRALPRLGAELAAKVAAQELRIGALHGGGAPAAAWLAEAGIGVTALAGMTGGRLDEVAPALDGAQAIGAGETEAQANRPVVLCIDGVRIGILSYGEQRAGGFGGRADILGLMAYDQVRLLLNRCDHVLVLVRAGLSEGELPLPEWRARYRRFIDAGASVVADTGAAKGWEAYKNGLVFYGLGAPEDADSLGLFLTLRRNGRFCYEACALECAAGELDFSQNDAFKARIDAQNALLLDDAAYLRAADEMCLRIYAERARPPRRGMLGALLPDADGEERLFSLLGDESRRLMALRAISRGRADEKKRRENTKKP